MATQTRVRSKDAEPFKTGDLSVYGGIVSGFVQEYADALECSPAAVLEAVEAGGIQLYFDTARQKNDHKPRDRPTAPDKRCIAMRAQELALLRQAVENGPDPVPDVLHPDPEPAPEVDSSEGGQYELPFGSKEQTLCVRVSPATKAALAAEADAQGESLSAIARDKLRAAL